MRLAVNDVYDTIKVRIISDIDYYTVSKLLPSCLCSIMLGIRV